MPLLPLLLAAGTFLAAEPSLAAAPEPARVPASLPSRRTPTVEAVERVAPAVVNISTERTVLKRQYPFGTPSTLEDLFFGLMNPSYAQANVPLSIGTGVIIDAKGLVLTNQHILLKASAIKVALNDSRSFNATVVGADPYADLAVLQIDAAGKNIGFPFVRPASSADLMIGETVIAIGNPFGLSHTVTSGIISALKRQLPGSDEGGYDEFIQTDASINPGNSGGPLLNIRGELIGINTAVLGGSRDRQAEGIGFAIPIDFAKRVVDDLLVYGRLQPVFAGFRVIKQRDAVWVAQIDESGPAFRAGIRTGDLLQNCNGVSMRGARDLLGLVMRLAPGQTLDCNLRRIDREYRAAVVSQSFPPRYWQRIGREIFGLQLQQLPRQVVIAAVHPNLPAQRVGLRAGDVILQIDGNKLATLNDFAKIAPHIYYRSHVLLVIERGGGVYYATVPLEP